MSDELQEEVTPPYWMAQLFSNIWTAILPIEGGSWGFLFINKRRMYPYQPSAHAAVPRKIDTNFVFDPTQTYTLVYINCTKKMLRIPLEQWCDTRGNQTEHASRKHIAK